MGLDMYLYLEDYIGGEFEHRNVKGKVKITYEPLNSTRTSLELDASEISSIRRQVGYWHKANAIHNWFVQEIANGKDECQEIHVSWEQLDELEEIVCKILKHKNNQDELEAMAQELLPPTSGFFFGDTGINEWYIHDLEETLTIIKEAKKDRHYLLNHLVYQASW